MILLAAKKLEEQGQTPFSAEDLVVMSWKEFPQPFGLKGYTDQFPDSNRVLSSIMGEKGLARKGWLVKMGQKLYTLSPEGHKVIRRLLSGEPPPEEEATVQRLPREQEKVLLTFLDSSAFEKYSQNRLADMSFADACRFWGITEHLTADALDERLDLVGKVLDQAHQLSKRGSLELGTREVSTKEINRLFDVHEFLQDRFARHLSLLRSRSSR
jgi:hypothetical protein